ncbi:leucine-rich repeat domain-containing protein, partial [Wolbachia endosymbiont of Pentidionis agamae]|uniref:hypothetical protein n=1 Tax=Wolbachia endosymbiont of Pentidionis agamae TaxID=3110435 RepID=UPI002FD1E32D
IDLSYTDVKDLSLIKCLINLRSINLNATEFNGLELRNFPKLESLDLCACRHVNDGTLKDISKHCKELTSIDLMDTLVGVDVIEKLWEALPKLKSLGFNPKYYNHKEEFLKDNSSSRIIMLPMISNVKSNNEKKNKGYERL